MFKNLKKLSLVLLLILGVSFLDLKLFAKSAEDEKALSFKIGVNRFAWYATLQTINFMPLISADPFSGVIITDWYSISENERYKLDVYILEELLTANTIDVRVFKQKKVGGLWVNDTPKVALKTQIENSILDTARKLRIEYILGNK